MNFAGLRPQFWRGGYLLWVALVLLLAHFSGFRADAVPSVNWDVILLLTPWGLTENLILGANAYLHKVYWYQPPPLTLTWAQDQWNWHYLYIYLQSNLLEVIPLLILWPRWRPLGVRTLQISILNSLTHPIVFFVLMKLPLGYLPNVLLAETFAIMVEGLVYQRLGLRRPFAASLFANLVSWQVAPVITAYWFLWDKFI